MRLVDRRLGSASRPTCGGGAAAKETQEGGVEKKKKAGVFSNRGSATEGTHAALQKVSRRRPTLDLDVEMVKI